MTGCCAPSPACPAGCPGMACEWLGAPAPASAGTKGSARVTLPPPSIHLTCWVAAAGKEGGHLSLAHLLRLLSPPFPPLSWALPSGWAGTGKESAPELPSRFLSYLQGPASLSAHLLDYILTLYYITQASLGFRAQNERVDCYSHQKQKGSQRPLPLHFNPKDKCKHKARAPNLQMDGRDGQPLVSVNP